MAETDSLLWSADAYVYAFDVPEEEFSDEWTVVIIDPPTARQMNKVARIIATVHGEGAMAIYDLLMRSVTLQRVYEDANQRAAEWELRAKHGQGGDADA